MRLVRYFKVTSFLSLFAIAGSAFAANPLPSSSPQNLTPYGTTTSVTTAVPVGSGSGTTVGSITTVGPVNSVNVPCTNGPTTVAGLRSCSLVVPQMISQINSMMQVYGSCYYKGIDLDTSLSSTVPTCTQNGSTSNCTVSNVSCVGPNFGLACSLVPNQLNNNMVESSTNNVGTSCGTPMQIAAVSIASCGPAVSVTQQQNEFLQNNGYSGGLSALEQSLDSTQAEALLAKAQAGSKPVVSGNPVNGRSVCITLDANGTNGSLERSYMKGAFIQALAYYANQVTSQINCSHSLPIQSTNACQAFATQVASLGATTQSTITSLQTLLGTQANVGDVDAAFTSTFNQTLTSNGYDPGQLRQSAQHLSSARSGLESTFTQLAMCSIFAQAQSSYLANVGLPTVQAALLNNMDNALDPVCRPQCKSQTSLSGMKSCLQKCYTPQAISNYLTPLFQSFWPIPSGSSSDSCPTTGGANVSTN
jgi:hypothetical protein